MGSHRYSPRVPANGGGTANRDVLLERLRERIEDTLRDQHLVLARAYWLMNSGDNSRLLEPFGLLSAGAEEQLAALKLIREVNRAVHEGKRTQGASQLLPLVAASQGGHYCRMCGESQQLHVDHIVPTSRAGTEHASNLQLLCGPCNLGKGATIFGNIPNVLRINTDDSISDGLRFLRLSLMATESKGRPLGRCDAGHLADEAKLFVACQAPLAANLTNLHVTCEVCNG
jgi:hypothetical protein